VLSALGVGKLVTLEGALAGFSNPAVVTVWSMFILSAGLSATGVADIIGQQVMKIAGKSEPQMILVIMLTTGILSAFMNNIGVAALMLPVVMDIARRTETPPSRLLMPMAYSSLLGGLTTLVGTPPNLVASNALEQAGLEGFSLFSFTPVGAPALIIGSLFVAFIGRHILPKKMPDGFLASREKADSEFQFAHDIEGYHFKLRVGEGSPFDGKTLNETNLGAALGLNLHAIERDGEFNREINSGIVMHSGDILHVRGRVEDYRDFMQWQTFEMASGSEMAQLLSIDKLALVSAEVKHGADIEGLTIAETDFRRRFKAHILTIKRDGKVHRGNFPTFKLVAGDVIQLEMRQKDTNVVTKSKNFSQATIISEESFDQIYRSTDSLMQLNVPESSHLIGLTVQESGIGDSLRMRIVAIGRRSGSVFLPKSDEVLQRGDKLMVHGGISARNLINGIRSLELVESDETESADLSDTKFSEVTLSPQSALAGKTLKELDFRRRFGLDVLSIWRGGRSFGSHLRNFQLNFGDALLVSGSKENLEIISKDDDFLILSKANNSEKKASGKMALLASIIMLTVVATVLVGFLPIAIAAVAGATVMIITKCLTIQEAYKSIEWKSVFLIACMIPLGAAMKDTGAAEWLAQGVAAVAEPFGPWGMIIGLYLLTALATTIVPTAALVLIMAHIGMDAATRLDIPPQMIVMAIAMAASASFTSPISHPANVL
ncbi:MAG: SLC13 family permease, partial [Verrucomicrobiota bacterium]